MNFLGVALDIECEQAGKHLISEGREPEQTTLIGAVALAGLVQKDGISMCGEVVPAIGAEHGAIHLSVKLAEADDVVSTLRGVVEAVVGFSHPFIAGDH